MSATQEYSTIVRLNTQEAQNQLDKLQKKVEDLRAAKEKALSNRESVKAINQDLKKAEAELKSYQTNVKSTIDTLKNLGSSSVKELKATMKALKREQDKVTSPEEYARLQELIDQCAERMDGLKNSTKRAAEESQVLQDQMQNLAKVMQNVGAASMEELKQAEQYLVQQMNGMNPNSDAYAVAGKQLQQVRQRVAELNAEHQRLNRTIDQYDREIKEAQKDVEILKREQDLVNKTMANLSTASYRDLNYALKITQEEMQGVGRGSATFKALEERARKLKEQLGLVKEEAKASGNAFSRFIRFLNVNWGAITQLFGAFSGLTLTIRQCVKAFADMEEKMADVRKYTGLTTAEVELLNEELKKMDTRTSREQLNELAGAAGRLGITAKEDILEFVEAADTIGIALGDDLGDGAVDQIGKLAMAFGEDKNKGLRGAMLATGSAINELAQNSAAKAGYLVEFAARLAGVGKQAGMSQAQIFGLAAALDENMMKEEMSATAISQLLVKMQTDTVTFAKITGKSVSEWSNLIKTDFNGALTLLLQKLKDTGDMNTMAKMFEDMGTDGTRAITVLTAMADKVDDVVKHQNTAAEAYREGNSVLKEAAVMNDTVQARLDKAKKTFNETAIALGQQLEPAAKYTISTFALLTKSLGTIMTFITEHIGLIVTLTASIVAYNVAANAMYLAQKLISGVMAIAAVAVRAYKGGILLCSVAYNALTGNIVRCTAAMRLFNTVTRLNPIGALVTVITLAVGAILTLTSKTKEGTSAWEKHKQELQRVKEAQENVNRVSKEAAQSVQNEISKVEQLSRIVHNNKLAYDTRREALEALQKIVPAYHAQLTKEGKLINDNIAALKEYADKLILEATIKAYAQDIAELNKQLDMLQDKNAKIRGSLSAVERQKELLKKNGRDTVVNPYTGDLMNSGEMSAQYRAQEAHSARLAKNERDIADAMAKRKALQDSLDRSIEKNKDAVKALAGGTGGYTSQKDLKKQQQADKKATAEQRRLEAEQRRQEAAALKALKEKDKKIQDETDAEILKLNEKYASGNIKYREYIDEQFRIDKEGLERRKGVWNEGSHEYIAIQEAEQKLTEQYNCKKLGLDLEALERQRQSRAAILESQFYDEKSELYQNEDALNEALFCNDMDYLLQKQDLYQKGTEEWYDLEAEITSREEQNMLDKKIRHAQRLQQYREEWLGKDHKKQEEITLQGLEDLHNKGMISEEDYQKMLLRIKQYYADQAYQIEKEEFERERGLKEKSIAQILEKARRAVSEDDEKKANISGAGIGGDILGIVGTIKNYKTMYEQIEQMRAEDKEHEEEYAEAKRQLNAQMMESIVAKVQAAYSSINQIVNAAAAYSAACSQYEVAKITADYDKQIKAAGKNSKKKEQLEKERDEKIRKAKSEANKKAMKIEMAQAIASNALAAINAYSSAAKVPYVGYILGPIAAAAALAAGALQIETIKKQHQAEELGYYEGGYTGGNRYRREAGVVHEGEFVGNHFAVQNPTVRPVFDLIDQAQRNNTIGKLDLPAAMGAGGQATVVAPVVNVTMDNSDLQGVISQMNAAISALNAQLDAGINAPIYLDGHDGLMQKQKEYNRLKAMV